MKRTLMRKKATACLLILVMLFSFTGGLFFDPGVVQAEGAGDFKLIVGHYRGLKQELTVPVMVQNAQNLVALEFKVESQSNFSIDVAVKNVEWGEDRPDGAQLTWSGAGHGNVKIAIYMYEEGGGFSGDGELVRITYTHNGTEQTYRQPVDLVVPPSNFGAWAMDDEIEQLPITQNTIRNGQIMVAIMYGDMNKDDSVTISDAVLALQASVGELEMTPQLKDAADVKRDPGTEYSSITVYDALLIARHSLGVIQWFPVNRNLFVFGEAVDDDDDLATAPFHEPPSSIWIGDKKMLNTRTTIGGTVTFTINFDNPVNGSVRVQIGDLIEKKEIDGTEIKVTMDLKVPALYAGTGDHEIAAYQYNPVSYENGIPIRRFIRVVDPDKEVSGVPVYPPPELLITDISNGELEFTWDPVLAANSIKLLQSFDHGDEKNWLPAANLLEPILSYAESAKVSDLDPKRGYYYKLEIDGGVHGVQEGESNMVSFKRMSGDAIAEQAGADLYVSVLYTGRFHELNLAAAGDFMLVKNGVGIKAADHIELIKPGAIGIKLLFEGTEEENFSVAYNETAGSLDLDDYSYVLSEDSVDVGDGGSISEVTVTSRSQFLSALANDSINRIVFADDITLNQDETATMSVTGQAIDGQGFTLTGDVAVSGSNAEIHDLTIDGDLDVTGNNFTGQSLIVEGTATVDGEEVNFNTTFKGPVIVNGEKVTFGNVTFKDVLTISPSAIDIKLDGSHLWKNADVLASTNFKDVTFADDVTVTVTGAAVTLTFEGSNNVASGKTLRFAGSGSLDGDDATMAGAGNVEFKTAPMAAIENLTFGVPVAIDVADMTFTEVSFNNEVSVNENTTFVGGGYGSSAIVAVADGIMLTFEAGDAKVNNAGKLVVEGTAAVDFANDMATDLENAIGITVVSFADVGKGIDSTTPAAFDLTFTLAGMKPVSGAAITVGLGQLTLTPGAFELTLDGNPVTGPAITGVNAVAGTADAALDATITITTGTGGLEPGQYTLYHAEGIATSANVDETVTANITAGGIGFEFTYKVGDP